MTFNPFRERQLRVTVNTNRVDKTGATVSETFSWQLNRMRITVSIGGGVFGNAQIRVAGLSLDAMNKIARIQNEPNYVSSSDTVTVDMWDDIAQVFLPFYAGMITWSSIEIQPPESWLLIEANYAGQLFNIGDAPAYSNAGPVALSSVLTTLAGYAGFVLDFSPLATDYACTNLHLTGSPLEQIAQIMRQFPDLDWSPHLQRLRVWPIKASYGDDPLRVATDSGLVGFPSYGTSGLTFRTLFNPALIPGRAISLETGLDFVDRTSWSCAVVQHAIEPNMPGGQWFSNVVASYWQPKSQGAQ